MTRFDEENAQDPAARELLYAQRLTDWVRRLEPEASEALRLAARSQHIRRWEVPRAQFPADRAGYHRWRNHLKQFHAEIAGKILAECGCGEELISRVQALNRKTLFPHDPDSQTLEDALCLVFLEFQLADLAARTDDAKVINALRKSWQKMSVRARAAAGTLAFGPREKALLEAALSMEL